MSDFFNCKEVSLYEPEQSPAVPNPAVFIVFRRQPCYNSGSTPDGCLSPYRPF